MAKNKPSKSAKTATTNEPLKKNILVKKDLLDNLDTYFQKHSKLFLFLSLGLSVLFSLLLFDVKVGIGGDDSSYILRSSDFVHKGVFPGYQGPLYPMFISPFIAVFGINLPLLKFLSLIFIVISVYFLYKGFSGILPQSVVSISILLLSINYYVMYFASQTYSEAFFIMLEALLFWYFAKKFIKNNDSPNTFSHFLILGLLLFLMAITRSVSYAALAAVLGYFLLRKEWKNSLQLLIGFFIFYVAFEILKRLIWGGAELQFATQSSSLLNKNFYNPAEGKEDLMGFVTRFFKNSNQYFSKHFFKFIGFREELPQTSILLTLITWFLLILSFFQALRKNRYMLLIAVYTIVMCIATFLILQVSWDQWRLIIIEFPFMLILSFGGLYYLFKNNKFKSFQFAIPVLAVIILFTSFGFTGGKVKIQKEALAKNLKGDLLYGFTPDWVNYIEMCKWVAKNTPKEDLIGVRKPEISFIYTNRDFVSIRDVPSITTDSLITLMPDTLAYIGIKMEDAFFGSPIFADPQMKQKIVGFVNGKFSFNNSEVTDGNIIGVFKFSKNEFPLWEEKLTKAGIFYDKNIIDWIKKLKTVTNEYSVYIPEILLDRLHSSKVKYLILASLRANPYQNTGNIITTLHRYVNFIQMKYPQSFALIYTIGTDEVAQLVELKI